MAVSSGCLTNRPTEAFRGDRAGCLRTTGKSSARPTAPSPLAGSRTLSPVRVRVHTSSTSLLRFASSTAQFSSCAAAVINAGRFTRLRKPQTTDNRALWVESDQGFSAWERMRWWFTPCWFSSQLGLTHTRWKSSTEETLLTAAPPRWSPSPSARTKRRSGAKRT